MTLTAEQDAELTKIQSVNIAAKALAQSAYMIGVTLETLLPMVTALAEKELKKLNTNG